MKDKLTDEEFYTLVAMGVPFEMQYRDGKKILVSKECNILKDGKGGYRVNVKNG